MTITLEAIRAAGGIVHSDGNIFFRDISMLQALAVAAPAAVAPQGEYPQLPEAAVWSVAGEDGMPTLGKGWMFSPVQQGNATLPLFTARQMWAYHDLGRRPAPAAPAPLAAKPGGTIAVPFDLVVAACSAIDKKRDAPKILAELRRYTTGDLSRALEAPAAPATPVLPDIDAGIEVMAWLRENRAPHSIYCRMSACLFGDPDKRAALAAAPQAPAAPSGLPHGWVPCILTHDGQHPEEVAYGPQIMMDRLKKWLGRYFELLAQKVLAEPVHAEMLAALQAVALDVVHVGAGENAISDAARAKVEAVLEKIGAPWPGHAAAPAGPVGTDEVTCTCGATWERHGHCDYEMVHTPRKAAPAAPVGEYTLVDEGSPVELAGAQAQYSIERADGSTAAWLLGDGSAVAELMAALRMPVSDAPEAAPAAPSAVEGVVQFRKRPVTTSAIQWTGKNLREVITFTDGPPETRGTHAGMAWEAYTDLVERDGLKIYTLEGKMLANVGDWIIRGVKGEHYPCKPDIFAETYEPVGAAPAAPAVDAETAKKAARYDWLRAAHDRDDNSVVIFIDDEQHGPGHLDRQVDDAMEAAAQAKEGGA